jgi:protein tyrosine phosphatase
MRLAAIRMGPHNCRECFTDASGLPHTSTAVIACPNSTSETRITFVAVCHSEYNKTGVVILVLHLFTVLTL